MRWKIIWYSKEEWNIAQSRGEKYKVLTLQDMKNNNNNNQNKFKLALVPCRQYEMETYQARKQGGTVSWNISLSVRAKEHLFRKQNYSKKKPKQSFVPRKQKHVFRGKCFVCAQTEKALGINVSAKVFHYLGEEVVGAVL